MAEDGVDRGFGRGVEREEGDEVVVVDLGANTSAAVKGGRDRSEEGGKGTTRTHELDDGGVEGVEFRISRAVDLGGEESGVRVEVSEQKRKQVRVGMRVVDEEDSLPTFQPPACPSSRGQGPSWTAH